MESPVIIENCANLNLGNNNYNTGFPFDDTEYDTSDRLQSTLNDIAQRHPEFADHLNFPTWRRKRFGSGSSTDREEPREPQRNQTQGQSSRSFDTPDRRFGDHSFPSGFNRFPFSPHFDDFDEDITVEKPPEVPRNQEKRGRKVNPNLPQHLSNTVDLGQKQAPVEETRGQRSMSAPPENRTSRNSSERDMGSYLSRPNRTQPTTSQQNNPRERIIPIHVEGRDEPILPKNINIEVQRPEQNDTPSNINYQQATPKNQAPPTHQAQPASHKQATPPPEATPQPQTTTNKNDPLEKIKLVKSDVLALMQQVEDYAGTRKDKLYAYLDEMLTINLLKLDDIETEGKDNIRIARKEAIKCIQECISKLEAKALANERKTTSDENTTETKITETSEIKKSDSKPVFKSTASIELIVPNNSEIDIKSENENTQEVKTESQLLKTSQEPMEIDEIKIETTPDTSNVEVVKSEDLKSTVEPPIDVANTSQTASETNK